jgi:hypothetical protein
MDDLEHALKTCEVARREFSWSTVQLENAEPALADRFHKQHDIFVDCYRDFIVQVRAMERGYLAARLAMLTYEAASGRSS